MAAKDLEITQGKTFTYELRCETEPLIFKPITGISLTSGAPVLSVANHGLTNGWRVAPTRVKGMTQINAKNSPPRLSDNEASSDYKRATVVSAGLIELNGVSPYDDNGKEWPAYTEGGFIQFYTPMDLTGCTARMNIRAKANKASTLLASTELSDLPLNTITITVDNATKKLTVKIGATDTAAFAWTTGYYDIELVCGADVIGVASGRITVGKEVTTQ